MNKLVRIGLVLLLFLGSAPLIYAQTDSTDRSVAKSSFNPTNPAEPDSEFSDDDDDEDDEEEEEVIVYYKVTISSNPSSAGTVPRGGEFTSGSSKYVYTSLKNSKYKFSHWTLNGEFYSNNLSFYYKVGTEDANFVAHYKFVPSSPVEPDPMPEEPEPEIVEKKISPLYLTTNIEEACSFNQSSGNEYEEDAWVSVEAFVKKGYEFKGWYNGTTLISSSTRLNYQMPSEPTTLIAYVEKKVYNPSNPSEPEGAQGDVAVGSYNLIYVVDGEVYETMLVKFGTSITPFAPLHKEGYTFSGWSEIPETMPDYDVVVTGSFTVNSYTITYIVDGEEYKSVVYNYGENVLVEESPVKEGYTFSGWSEFPTIMPAKDTTISGSFTVNNYTITFKIGDKVVFSESMEYGASIVAPEAPEKEGHTFISWGEVAETVPANDVTYEGSYSVNSYKLTYSVDGEIVEELLVEYGAAITLPDTPTKEGYTFSSWSEAPETMPAEDVVIYGTFKVNQYSIIYMVDGEVFATETIDYGADITLPEIPEKEGYAFAWVDEIPEAMPAKDITIYGVYTEITNIEDVAVEGDVLYIYTLDGQRISKLRQGINILWIKDGSTRKVLVK